MAVHSPTAPAAGPRAAPAAVRRHHWAGPGMVLPFLLLYLLFMIGPVAYNLVVSLFNTSLVHSGLGPFVGLRNYGEALTSADFWHTLWHTVWFTVLTTVPLVALSLALALMAERVRRWRWLFRTVFFAPYVLPVSAVALVFTYVYADRIGLLQHLLSLVGVTSPGWLSDPRWVLPSVAAATVWWTLGFTFVLYLAALQDIPADVLEAAAIDGAGPVRRLRHVVVPMLGRTTALVTVLQVIASLKVFDQVYLIAGSGGGPAGAARSSVEYVYDSGFTDMRVGYAATVSFLLFLVMLAVSAVWFAVSRRTDQGV
ncbi:carbohydrate ABC transporter permease [Streptantibioticus silvisoli]|uniref:Sugar ABC transporter permease n=1 Tax=Streptantibioticus silvisoli TaxID=2705255 RepID=A0ABT6VYI4_9ACTN|nr:sugar ABC transporter permease [Streptantibioticus silvisoli]MDI5962538.1 sugar ABC transporter permease [Streptantibioticus silvisoli]